LIFAVCQPLIQRLSLDNGQVEEPHNPQSRPQESQEWHQEAPFPEALFHKGGKFTPYDRSASKAAALTQFSLQMDPKFLRNQRFAKKHNKKAVKVLQKKQKAAAAETKTAPATQKQ